MKIHEQFQKRIKRIADQVGMPPDRVLNLILGHAFQSNVLSGYYSFNQKEWVKIVESILGDEYKQ